MSASAGCGTFRPANRASSYWWLLGVLASHATPTLAPMAALPPKGMPASVPCQPNCQGLTILRQESSGAPKPRIHKGRMSITEFIATEASAQGAPPATTGGVSRKILSQMDGPVPGYETLLVEATIEPGAAVGRCTHPGIESAYFLEGGFDLPIQGQPTRTVKAGNFVQVPAGTPHAGGKPGDAKTRVLITYVVEKGKPLASPA
jgi:quercetin dioxygenase-like cupin family protein